jgi:2-polyprenyl-3-methyl-5-hydroxy-6-metoxy-1,4-benzoquinol methylase
VSSVTEEYDAVPFVGEAVPHAHPAFLETVTRLRGMRPAPAEKCRVLELGCGVGSNLLPMAERYPEATFVGVDLSGKQIEMAQSVARECELANVEFRQADVMQLGDELGTVRLYLHAWRLLLGRSAGARQAAGVIADVAGGAGGGVLWI